MKHEKIKQQNSSNKVLKINIVIDSQRSGTFLNVESSTSSPGGNQVDSLPPASSVKLVTGGRIRRAIQSGIMKVIKKMEFYDSMLFQ